MKQTAYAVRWLCDGTKIRLVRDEANGRQFVWKYYESRIGFVNGWFDFGPHFNKAQFAKQWIEDIGVCKP